MIEELEKEYRFFQIFDKWNTSPGCNSFLKQYHQDLIDYQHLCHQLSLMRYFSYPSTLLPDNKTLVDVISIIRNGPFRFHTKIAACVTQIVTQWIIDIVRSPNELAKVSTSYFAKRSHDLNLFAKVTYPSIMFHFQSYEFLESGSILIKSLIETAPSDVINEFLYSYIISSQQFVSVLWPVFWDKTLSFFDSNNDFFMIFLECLSNASRYLTMFHLETMKDYHKSLPKEFYSFLYQTLFLRLFNEFFSSKSCNYLLHSILDIFKFCCENPNSPQSQMVFCSIFDEKPRKHARLHLSVIDTKRTPICISCHECLMLQNLVQANPQLVSISYMQNLQIPQKSFNNFETVFIEFSMGAFEKAYKNDSNDFFRLNKEPYPIEKESSFLRAYNQLVTFCSNIGIDPVDVFSQEITIETSKLHKSVTLLKNPEFYLYVLKKSINMLKQSSSSFEDFSFHMLNYEITNQTFSLCKYYQNHLLSCLSDRIIKGKINVNYQSNVFPYSDEDVSPSLKRLLDQFPPEADPEKAMEENQAVLTTMAFNDKGMREEHLGNTKMLTPSLNIQMSTFDLESIQVVAAIRPKRERRKSAEYDKAQTQHNIKNEISQIVGKCQHPDLKTYLSLRKLDECSIDSKMKSLRQRYIDLLQIQRIRNPPEYINVEGCEFFTLHLARKLDSLEDLRPSASILGLIEVGILILEMKEIIHGKKKTQQSEDMGTSLLTKALLLSQRKGAFDAYIWMQKIRILHLDFQVNLPNKYSKSVQFIEGRFWMFLDDMDPKLNESCRKCNESLFD